MVIRADRGGTGGWRRAAWPRSRAGMAAGARRAVRCPGRRGVLAVAAVSCAGLLAAGLGAAAPAAASARRGSMARPAGSGGRLWVSSYQGPGGDDSARSVAVSPDGGTVFVTGASEGELTLGHLDYATVAYNASTGAQLWVRRYNGPANGQDMARSIAVSPDGSAVFVTGASDGGVSSYDYATVGYDAATGARLWVRRYHGPANGNDGALQLAVSPDGGAVFVTGGSQSGALSCDYATVAYDASTGAQLWVRRYHGPRGGKDYATSIAVSPSGGRVFVTGGSAGRASKDYATIAYDAVTGARLWVRRYNGPASGWDYAHSLAVSPDGRSVFVTGESEGIGTGLDYATIGYRAATGRRLWVSRYNARANQTDDALQVAAGPGGHRIFVTGTSQGKSSGQDYATIGYNAATGARLWASRYNDPANADDLARALAVGPAGHAVYVTGVSDVAGGPAATVAYSAATGAQVWARLDTFGGNSVVPYGIAASPGGGAVVVTGGSGANVYVTIAYLAGPVPAG